MPSFTCLICDFGFAHFLGDGLSVVSGLRTPKTTGLTYRYAAPELLDAFFNHEQLCHKDEGEMKIDVYAFAITLYQVIFNVLPWEGMSKFEIYDQVSEGKRPEIPEIDDNVPEDLVNLVISCWSQESHARPNFEEIVELLTKG